MPNCKYDAPKLCDARDINELETLAQIARTLSRKTKQEEVLLELVEVLDCRDFSHHEYPIRNQRRHSRDGRTAASALCHRS